MKSLFSLFLLSVFFFFSACSKSPEPGKSPRVLRTCMNKNLATLDPAMAADMACQYMVASFYDTPLQYSLVERPYRLEPSMLKRMPEISGNATVFECELRDDLYFQPGSCFQTNSRKERKITSTDVVFSILRLADSRLKSSGYWLIRGKLKGIEEFRKRTASAETGDMSPYDVGCAGLRVIDDTRFTITLSQPDPRFIYALAMPYFSVVSRKAVEHWKDKFADHPVGSGPFVLSSWKKDYQIRMKRNPDYRRELFDKAEQASDRTRPLPFLDEIVCSFIKQPLAGWLLFLQGELDFYVLDGENFAAVVNEKLQLAPSLTNRGITLTRTPEFQTNYIGFNFADPLLGQNENLRKAISLAFDKQKRLAFFSGRIELAYGPVPPGADAYLDQPGAFGGMDLKRARKYMELAGFKDGVNPATGMPLEITFDQAGSDSFYRQTAELLAIDLRAIGIHMKPEFNNRARFLQKLAQGQTQLFRLSWTGDYPDAENFLQLFYGPNSGSSNRVGCAFSEFDKLYLEVQTMMDSPLRKEKYEKMAKMIANKCPWIFESHPVSFMLKHSWLENHYAHDFAFNRWKYLAVDVSARKKKKAAFTPLSMNELRK